MTREKMMRLALHQAQAAFDAGEVPVGCVIADGEGRIIGAGRNRREETHRADAHAEIEAIRDACKALGTWHLEDCTLCVTLEPCPMCTGAIINARRHGYLWREGTELRLLRQRHQPLRGALRPPPKALRRRARRGLRRDIKALF